MVFLRLRQLEGVSDPQGWVHPHPRFCPPHVTTVPAPLRAELPGSPQESPNELTGVTDGPPAPLPRRTHGRDSWPPSGASCEALHLNNPTSSLIPPALATAIAFGGTTSVVP